MEPEFDNQPMETQSEPQPARRRGRRPRWLSVLCVLAVLVGALGLLLRLELRYRQAQQALAAGDEATAVMLFYELGNYRDARTQRADIENRMTYRRATEYMELGVHAMARDLFLSLGDYADARQRAEEAGNWQTYELAQLFMEQGEYLTAQNIFAGLGDFADALQRGVEAGNRMTYRRAEDLFAAGYYQQARQEFLSLADFADAPERVQQMERYVRSHETFQRASAACERGEYLYACRLLDQLEVPDFPGAAKLRSEALDSVYQMCQNHMEQGERLSALVWMEFLSGEDYEPVQGLRGALDSALEPDYRFYDGLKPQPPKTVTLKTTAQEFAHIYMNLFLTGRTKRTLAVSGANAYDSAAIDRMLDTVVDGYLLADGWLAEYGCLSKADILAHSEGYGPLYLTVAWSDGTYTDGELKEHLEQVDAFCSGTIRELARAGLLDEDMTYRQRARVIYDWLCYCLDYDDSMQIHNAALAIEAGMGVCESYTALYGRICNLAGIPTWSQNGRTQDAEEDETHIWTIQMDEAGAVFYTDVTWGDVVEVAFGEEAAAQKPDVDDFVDCYQAILWRQNRQTEELREGMDTRWSRDEYFWQESLWDSHEAFHTAQQIMELF